MDQQTRARGTYVVAVLLFMLAFIFFCMGVGLLFSFPDMLSLVGVAILAFCGVFIYSGIRNIKDANQMKIDARNQLKSAAEGRNSIPYNRNAATADKIPVSDGITVLARWQYTGAEWKRFMKWERSRRKTSSVVESILIITFGSLLLRSLRGAAWPEAVVISSVMAVIYGLGKYFISMNGMGSKQLNEIIITSRSVMINGKVNSFNDGLYWLKKVEFLEEKDITVIEFEYGWNTRKGPSSEKIRVPVPINKTNEAKEIIKMF